MQNKVLSFNSLTYDTNFVLGNIFLGHLEKYAIFIEIHTLAISIIQWHN